MTQCNMVMVDFPIQRFFAEEEEKIVCLADQVKPSQPKLVNVAPGIRIWHNFTWQNTDQSEFNVNSVTLISTMLLIIGF